LEWGFGVVGIEIGWVVGSGVVGCVVSV